MTPERMAEIHARAFAEGWTARAIADLLSSTGTLAIAQPHAFALIRVVADEAELLTLATEPDHRRQGLARSVLLRAEAIARTRGAERLFLEVAESNEAARALYSSQGYRASGRRRAYYRDGSDAILMEKTLDPAPSLASGE